MQPEPPRQGRTTAALLTLAEAAISAVPIVGGPVAALLTAGVGEVVNRRLTEWFADVAEAVEQLAARVDDVQPEHLAQNEAFTDAVMTAARTVEKTSEQEKLDALRNAVLNSVMPGAPDADVRASFFAMVDDLTPSHLRLLALFDDPSGWFDTHLDLVRPQPSLMSSRRQLVDAALPALAGEVGESFVADLSSRRLINAGSLGTTMSAQGIWDRVTSSYGRLFLAFVAEPVAPQ